MSKETRWVILTDLQIPYHDKRKLTATMKFLKQWKPDHITLLGDIDHMESVGRWVEGTPEEWKQRVVVTTETDTKKWLRELRQDHIDAQIDFKGGNHEARLEDYVSKKAAALDGLVTIPRVLDLPNLGIPYRPYSEPPEKMYGKYYVHHGTYVSKHASDSAQKELEHYGVSGFTGHSHRHGYYSSARLDGTIDEWWECGHLSDPKKQEYSQHHNWQAGFMLAYVYRNKVYPVPVKFEGHRARADGVWIES